MNHRSVKHGAKQVAYDGVGNQAEVVWPAGTSGTGSYSVNYKYDAMNRMQYVNEGGTNNLLAQYSWDALSRAQSIAYGDGTSDAYSQYDAGDNLNTLTQTYNGSSSSVAFNYTWLMNHQLNSAAVNNPLFQYVPQAGTVSYGAANVDNGLTTETASSGSATMTYDGNYNLTFDGYNTLSYDVENRMVQAVNAPSGASAYLYDPLGQRKQKVVGVNTAAPVATDFVLAGGEEIGDYYEASATWRLTVRGAGGLPLVTVVPAAGGGSEEMVYVHHDVKGSTVALTVPGGTGPAETYTYSDYGAPQSGSWLAYQYAGYRYDSETGLYYMPARYYSPTLGRFLQADPSGFGGGLNLYAYAGNDPVNLTDSTGQSPDGGGFTVTLSLSVANPFMGLFGVPQVAVSATACSGCFAQLKYRHVPGTSKNHSFWWVGDRNGTHWVIAAYPTQFDSGFLDAHVTQGDSGFNPKDNSGDATSQGGAFSGQICDQVDRLISAADRFISSYNDSIEYNGLNGPNSNGFARWVGAKGGFNPPSPPLAQAWDVKLGIAEK